MLDSSIESLPDAEVDVARLSIALTNLIDGAVGSVNTDAKVCVRSHLAIDRADAVIQIDYTGFDTEVAEQRRVFEQHSRGLTAAKMGYSPGSELRLWEARAIIAAHGGEISLRSRPTSSRRRLDRLDPIILDVHIPLRPPKTGKRSR